MIPLPLRPVPSQISTCLNLPLGTQGRSRRLNEAHFLRTRNGGPRKACVPRSPTGPCSVTCVQPEGKLCSPGETGPGWECGFITQSLPRRPGLCWRGLGLWAELQQVLWAGPAMVIVTAGSAEQGAQARAGFFRVVASKEPGAFSPQDTTLTLLLSVPGTCICFPSD